MAKTTTSTSSGFYTVGQVARLARVPLRTLYEWQSRGIVGPSLSIQAEGKTLYGYSYADLTLVRLIRALREDEIDFKSAAVALRHLYTRLGPPDRGWAEAHVYFVGRHIFAEQPDGWPVSAATEGGVLVMEGLFGDLFDELRGVEAGASFVVPSQFRSYVEIDPSVMGGSPVVRGTRIPTSLMAALHQAGKSAAQIARLYGTLSRAVVDGVLAYERYLDSAGAPA